MSGIARQIAAGNVLFPAAHDNQEPAGFTREFPDSMRADRFDSLWSHVMS